MRGMQLHPNAQAVQDALDAAGATDASGQPCRVHILPDAVHTAPAAAAALGVEVGQIANSLIFAASSAASPAASNAASPAASNAANPATSSAASNAETSDDEPLLILTSGAHRVDTDKVAKELQKTLKRAKPDFVKLHTGQVIGGVSPLGHPKPVQTLVDTALAQYEEIWAAGGVPQAVFPITYAELVRITAGTPADVA
jgi:prolyl-tRNA editing enzyme YbaK/EbsC (Cys-tRNA(Pro) deacylase)